MVKNVPLPMSKNLSTEVAGAIADALRETATHSHDETQSVSLPPSDPAEASRPVTGVLRFAAGLLSNSGVSRLFGAGSSKGALLRGSLVGLASGVEAAAQTDPAHGATSGNRKLNGLLTISAYVLGGIVVALIIRALRGEDEPTTPPEP